LVDSLESRPHIVVGSSVLRTRCFARSCSVERAAVGFLLKENSPCSYKGVCTRGQNSARKLEGNELVKYRPRVVRRLFLYRFKTLGRRKDTIRDDDDFTQEFEESLAFRPGIKGGEGRGGSGVRCVFVSASGKPVKENHVRQLPLFQSHVSLLHCEIRSMFR
jgi:hypothetical protein